MTVAWGGLWSLTNMLWKHQGSTAFQASTRWGDVFRFLPTMAETQGSLLSTDLCGRDYGPRWEENTLSSSPAEAGGPHPKSGMNLRMDDASRTPSGCKTLKTGREQGRPSGGPTGLPRALERVGLG